MAPCARRIVGGATLALAAVATTACGVPGSAATDQQAAILGDAIAYPRQPDADSFARAALNTTLGRSGDLAILEASDLRSGSRSDAAARIVIRIHVPAHVSEGFGDRNQAAYDACYDLTFDEPSSSLQGTPARISCPEGAAPITPPSPTPPPTLPENTSAVMAKVLAALSPSPTYAEVAAALRAALPPSVRIDAVVHGTDVGIAAAVGHGDQLACLVASRSDGKVGAAYRPGRYGQPLETGCRAYLALPH